MAFREIGKGHMGLQTFCGYMNMPPVVDVTYNETVKSKLHPADVDVATQYTKDAAEELCREVSEEYDENIVHRGFASLNGVVTAVSIDTGKCLSCECLVKTCKACERWAPRKGSIEYENFIKEHECPINHVGSAGAMEAVADVNIFKKSVAYLQHRFTTYIGDGDSKAYPAVVASNPYGTEKPVNKGECVCHDEQKRVGGRLRKLKKANGSKLLGDKKKLGGVHQQTVELLWVSHSAKHG